MTTIGLLCRQCFFLWWLLSIPIDTITIVGWTSINPSYDLMWTEGVPGFWPIPICSSEAKGFVHWVEALFRCHDDRFVLQIATKKTVQDEKHKDWWLMLLSQSTYIVHKWRVLICHEDKVYVITPINILFRGGDNFWPLMKVKLMFLPHATYCSEGVANFNVMMMMMMMIMIMTIVSVEQRPGWGERV